MTRSFKTVFILLTTFLTFLSSVSCKKEPVVVTDIYFTNIQKGSVSMNEGDPRPQDGGTGCEGGGWLGCPVFHHPGEGCRVA